ncbi:MAG: CPXCG motif-containing cysteine-rich protein [Candidatus Pelagadaptatus aseana]|uniref:CPXCG motif-containing cysteine-rich protein n=1 Tax=Candidatus Pelagadaptatus aseana TaxID=3120508 RepID=UPI0039B35228
MKELSQVTMKELSQENIGCPYCGESIQVLIDPEDAGQQYIEDCQVCCRPITFSVSVGMDGELTVIVKDENDTL